ncbi:unnamed protein product [Orchesella dallaii]|uniref:TATA box-binding protein-like protein 2 n=1 Tax=Orchesella dallaii TaxID=48710 RepID=A0ABP1S1N2_9HEXA
MDIVSRNSISNESTEMHHEVYYTETEVREAAQESEGCATELGTFVSSFEHNSMECNPSDNSDSGYDMPFPEAAKFTMHRVPIDGGILSDASREDFQYGSYSWFFDPPPNEGTTVLSTQEQPMTIPNTGDQGAQLLANSVQSFIHYPFGVLPMESESVVFHDTQLLMPEEQFVHGSVDEEAVVLQSDFNDLTVNSYASFKGCPVKCVLHNINSSTVVEKEMEVSSKENDNCYVDVNDYINGNPLTFTVLEPAAVIAAETETNSSSSILNVFNDIVPYNAVKEEATELAMRDEVKTDPVYFLEHHRESATDESVPLSNTKSRNKKPITKRSTNEQAKTTEKPKKGYVKIGGHRGRGSAESNTSVTVLVKRGVDVNSLRRIFGSRLRYLSAVLQVTGVRYMTDYLPYEIMRRFRPEPDWSELKNLTKSQEKAEYDSEQRQMYFKSPFGLSGGNALSIPKDSESDGNPTYSPETVSSVGSADLNVTLDLEGLAASCPNTEFRDNSLPLIIRLREPTCCGLIYGTGKLIVVGARSFNEFRKSARTFARMVQKSSYKVRLTNLTVHSYLGLAKLPFQINVTGLVQHESISKFAK